MRAILLSLFLPLLCRPNAFNSSFPITWSSNRWQETRYGVGPSRRKKSRSRQAGARPTPKPQEDGRWMVTVYTPKAGIGHKVTIQASNKIVLKTWPSGKFGLPQSNMGWSLAPSRRRKRPPFSDFPLGASIGTNRPTVWPVDPAIRNQPPRLPPCLTISGKNYTRPSGSPWASFNGLRRYAHRGMVLDVQKDDPRPSPKLGYDEVSKRMIAKEG